MTIIDTHAHIYPDSIAQRAADSIGEFYHLSMHRSGTLSELLEKGAKAGITRFLVHSVAVTPNRVRSVNDYLMRAQREHGDRLIAFGSLHPAAADIESEIVRIKEGGLKGVKLHPDFQHFLLDEPNAISMFRLLAKHHMPVLVHTGDKRYPYSEPARMARALDAAPGLKAICAHLGGWSVWEEAWKVLAGRDDVWVDTSSSLYALTPEKAAEIIRRYGAERVFFGTDYPMWSPEEEIARVNALPLRDEEKEQIFHRSFEAFLKTMND